MKGTFIQNLRKSLLSFSGALSFLLWASLILILSFYFLDTELVRGNLWAWVLYTEITLSIIIAILFWVFVASSLYKLKYFATTGNKSKLSWGAGWVLWVIVSGCPSCSITLASYIGLAGFFSALPYNWLELKFLAVGLLMYSVYSNLKHLETCKLERKWQVTKNFVKKLQKLK